MLGIIAAYLGWVALISLVTFGVYGWDKFQARRGGWRIPEAKLHTLSLLGGWPGALAGQKFFHHKTIKSSFQLTFWGTVVLHIVIVISLLFASDEFGLFPSQPAN